MTRTHSENKLLLQAPPQGGERELEATRAALLAHAEARASDHRERCARAEAIRGEERRAVAEIFGGKAEAYKKACAAWQKANRLEGISEASLADAELHGRAARAVQEGRAVLSRLGVHVARLDDANLTGTWSSWRQQGDDAFYQSINPIPSNNVYWIHMVTTQPVPGRAWAWIEVGSRGSHYAAMNDTIGGTTLQSRWFFEEIYYRIL